MAATVASLGGCAGSGTGRAQSGQSAVPSPGDRAAQIVAAMGDEELVGQVLMPYAYGADATQVSAASQAANRKYAGVSTPAEIVRKYHLGGLILVSWSADDPTGATNPTTNVQSPGQIRKLTDGLQVEARAQAGKVPMLIGTDQEYGTVTRIREGIVQLPSAMALGAGHQPSVTEAAWRAAGRDLAALGVNVDFAPDADVLSSKPGGVIGSRSFGSNASAVADQVSASVRGLSAGGVIATLKHFPGHGNTVTDSHTALPVLSQSRKDLDDIDLRPFAAGIKAGAGMVMSGHLDVRAVDPGVTSSFSSKVLIDLLRTTMRFDGVVVTDSMSMEPAKKWGPAEAAVRALVAGNDLLLMPPNLATVQQGLLAALTSGSLPRKRLIEAATRVMALRLRVAAAQQPALGTINSAEGQSAAAASAAAAVTVLRGPCSGALVTGPVRVTATQYRTAQRDWLIADLKTRGITVTQSGGSRIHLVGYGDEADALAGDAAVTVALDTPYLLASAQSQVRLATYSTTRASVTALADVLTGKAQATGRAPVAIPGLTPPTCS